MPTNATLNYCGIYMMTSFESLFILELTSFRDAPHVYWLLYAHDESYGNAYNPITVDANHNLGHTLQQMVDSCSAEMLAKVGTITPFCAHPGHTSMDHSAPSIPEPYLLIVNQRRLPRLPGYLHRCRCIRTPPVPYGACLMLPLTLPLPYTTPRRPESPSRRSGGVEPV